MTQIIGAEKDELVGALRVVKQFLDQGHTLVWLIAEDDRPQPGFMEEELDLVLHGLIVAVDDEDRVLRIGGRLSRAVRRPRLSAPGEELGQPARDRALVNAGTVDPDLLARRVELLARQLGEDRIQMFRRGGDQRIHGRGLVPAVLHGEAEGVADRQQPVSADLVEDEAEVLLGGAHGLDARRVPATTASCQTRPCHGRQPAARPCSASAVSTATAGGSTTPSAASPSRRSGRRG